MRKYANDYKIEYEVDDKGHEKKIAVYRGAYYEVNVDESHLVRFKRLSLLIFIIMVIIHVASGFLQGGYNGDNDSFYVLLPYVIAYLPLYFLGIGIIRIPSKKRKYRRDEVGLSFDRVKKSVLATFILLLVGVVGEFVFLILYPELQSMNQYLYLGIQLLAAGGAYVLMQMRKPIQLSEIEENSKKSE